MQTTNANQAVTPHLLIFGLGYTGAAIAGAARAAGFLVTATTRTPRREAPDVALVPFDDATRAVAAATHVLSTAPPDEADGDDPVLRTHGAALAAAPRLAWAGYLSSTGVYGDHAGGWVDETTAPIPTQPRAIRRLAAERAWAALAGRIAVDLFRVAGIYGPGRSVFDDLRAGRARRVLRPGHAFGRIHREDIAAAVLAAAGNAPHTGVRVFNLADDEPAESAAVIEEAARLLGMAPPPAVPYEQAVARMSPMALSFWQESRRVSAAGTKAALGLGWRYPSYREGLRAILAEEGGDGAAEQVEIGRA